jgi:hypothetical protein
VRRGRGGVSAGRAYRLCSSTEPRATMRMNLRESRRACRLRAQTNSVAPNAHPKRRQSGRFRNAARFGGAIRSADTVRMARTSFVAPTERRAGRRRVGRRSGSTAVLRAEWCHIPGRLLSGQAVRAFYELPTAAQGYRDVGGDREKLDLAGRRPGREPARRPGREPAASLYDRADPAACVHGGRTVAVSALRWNAPAESLASGSGTR